MALLLGVDTGGTYTDAVIVDDETNTVLAKAKALTSRPDLSLGIGGAIGAVLERSSIKPAQIEMVSLSTTLATNALVEGQGGRIALIFIGFEAAEFSRAGLSEAVGNDPVISVAGGHSHSGSESIPLDVATLEAGIVDLPADITGIAVASRFATRNPAHEIAARDAVLRLRDIPVTCSHELSSALGGPKRALTAVLNARLIGLIARLIRACEGHLTHLGINARLMVVRGDGALVSADLAKVKPIETILSGPAASIAGASWLTGETDGLVSDIGGTTTDVCLLRDGKPSIDPNGARVGKFRTMVEAVAMRTWGLGGDSEVHLVEGLGGGLRLGPRRVMPISLLAVQHSELVHETLESALLRDIPAPEMGSFVVPLWSAPPIGLDQREQAIIDRLSGGPLPRGRVVLTRLEGPALQRLVSRGHVIVAGVTPSDAAHLLGMGDRWDREAAEKSLDLLARRRTGSGDRIAPDGRTLAEMIVAQIRKQTADCLLEAAFADDNRDWQAEPEALAAHELVSAGLDRHSGILKTQLSLGVPVIGLGASAASFYPPVGARLGTRMIVPEHADVANAVGAVVGQVSMQMSGTVTSAGEGSYIVHLSEGPVQFADRDTALDTLQSRLESETSARARDAGVEEVRLSVTRDIREVEIENRTMFIEAEVRVTAQGRPRIAAG